jgi:hypothetical protein
MSRRIMQGLYVTDFFPNTEWKPVGFVKIPDNNVLKIFEHPTRVFSVVIREKKKGDILLNSDSIPLKNTIENHSV